ncbi:chemotaxis protein CheX [Spirochaeta cellobiosiphila]|uniref:chemotaxis protein CheX n=1 Tax=Spirochaeta cellobiosiphila TaxID=504483 RepID=UPI000419162F|nr:chemotaxis protein CheX [Spirochaeta cellobiosiphila]
MRNEIDLALDQATIQTMADMAFLDVMPSTQDSIEYTNIFAIDFLAPYNGSMFFLLSVASKRQLVENIFGDDWDSLEDQKIDDCLLEILNILAGNFMSVLLKHSQKYKMSVPSILFEERELLKDCFTRTYDCEGQNIQVAVKLKEVEP